MLSHQFLINDCGVVTNPNIVFFSQKPKTLAWDYWSIRTGICENGLWDYALHYSGGGGPVSIGKFNSESEAIQIAITKLNTLFLDKLKGGYSLSNPDNIKYNYSNFTKFVASYQSKNIQISNLLNKSIQLSLF